MSPSLWVPNEVADSIIGEAEARRVLEHFRPALKAIDPRLDVLLVDSDQAAEEGLRLGFWHLIRRNADGTTTFWEVSDPQGRYMEPNDLVLEAFRRGDASRTDLTAERARQRERDRQAKERAKTRRAEELRGRLQEEADFAFRVQHRIKRKPFGRDAEAA